MVRLRALPAWLPLSVPAGWSSSIQSLLAWLQVWSRQGPHWQALGFAEVIPRFAAKRASGLCGLILFTAFLLRESRDRTRAGQNREKTTGNSNDRPGEHHTNSYAQAVTRIGFTHAGIMTQVI
jgi:hypothetical protein